MTDTSVKARPATFTLEGEARTYDLAVSTRDALKDAHGVWFRPTTASVTVTYGVVTAVEFNGPIVVPASGSKGARTLKTYTRRFYGPRELVNPVGQCKLLADTKEYALGLGDW